MLRKCKDCQVAKSPTAFWKSPAYKDGLATRCAVCARVAKRAYYRRNRAKLLAEATLWRSQNKEWVAAYKRKYDQEHPWLVTYRGINSRCTDPSNISYAAYGGRSIRLELTVAEIKRLWLRDQAENMEQPSIDRIDPDKNYTFENCRFIELEINRKSKRRKKK